MLVLNVTNQKQLLNVTNQYKFKVKIIPYLFLIVPLLLYICWIIGPMFYSFYLSLTDWDGLSQAQFIGMSNYVQLFKDPNFYTSLYNNLKWLISFITIPVAMGLGLAMIFNRIFFGVKIIKSIFFLPYILSVIVIGLIFGWIYYPSYGFLSVILQVLGLDKFANIGWLSNPKIVTWSIIFAALWRQVGYVMILYLAGLQAVDKTLIDAAKVDGSNNWQLFRYVVLPQLNPVTTIVVSVSVIDALRSFDMVYMMTHGGPGYSSSVLASLMYIEAFSNYNMGYAASIAVILFLIIAVFIFIYLWRIIKGGWYE